MKGLQAIIRIAREISAEFVGLLRRDVERCAACARVVEGLGPAWSVTEAMDFGTHVVVRFDRAPDTKDGQGLIVCIDEATGQITAKATVPSPPSTIAAVPVPRKFFYLLRFNERKH